MNTVPSSFPVELSRAQIERRSLLLAWAAMLLMSRLPQIVLKEFFVLDVHFGWWLLATAVLLIAVTFIWSPARPLRGYFLIMAAIALFTSLLDAPIRSSAAWQSWFALEKGWAINFFGQRLPLVVGLLFGKAMLATRGIALPVLLHMLVDTIIYIFLAMAAVAAGTLLPG